jgi:hypothetical protein
MLSGVDGNLRLDNRVRDFGGEKGHPDERVEYADPCACESRAKQRFLILELGRFPPFIAPMSSRAAIFIQNSSRPSQSLSRHVSLRSRRIASLASHAKLERLTVARIPRRADKLGFIQQIEVRYICGPFSPA